MDADPSLSLTPSRRRQDQKSNVGSSWEGTDLWCCAFHQQGRLARLFLAERVSRSHRLVCLSDHRHLRCFPELAKHSLHDDEAHDDVEEEKSRTASFPKPSSTQYTVTPRSSL